MRKKQIVILGGGFGGLRAALNIEKDLRRLNCLERYEITLVDRNSAHEYTPLLYEIATYSEEACSGKKLRELVLYPFRELLRGRNVRFIQNEVLEVQVAEGRILLREEKIHFDYLVLALGAEENYFDIPGAREHSFSIKTFQKAICARSAIFQAYKDHGREARIVVGGGGSTGVEFAAEIKNWLPGISVTLADSGQNVLSGFSPHVVRKACRRLRRLGVRVISNCKISRVTAHEIFGEDGRKIPFDVFLWTAGVRASSLSSSIPFSRTRGERVSISEKFLCIPEGPDLKVFGKIYAIGDMSCFSLPQTGQSVPMLAQVAIEQAFLVSKNIFEDIKKEEGIARETSVCSYKPKKRYPFVIPLGGKFAVAEIGPFVFSGYLAWVLKGLVEFKYLCTLLPFWRAFRVWFQGFWFFARNDRLG